MKHLMTLAAVLIMAASARAQYQAYYYSSSATTYSPPPGFPMPPGPTPVVVYASGAGTPVNYGTGRAVYYEPGYPTGYRTERFLITPPVSDVSNYYAPTFGDHPSYTYTPGYYTYYYAPAYYSPNPAPRTRYYRDMQTVR